MIQLLPAKFRLLATYSAIISIVLFISTHANAISPTLEEVLNASLTKANQNKSTNAHQYPATFKSSSWLASFPTIGLNYLDSQDIAGASEQEISLNLPLKSPFLRSTTAKLSQLNQQAKSIQQDKKKLYFSGLLRETHWNYRLLELRLLQANKKRELLEKLCKEYRALFQANEVEEYALMLIEQELSTQMLEISELFHQQQQWQHRYTSISGYQSFPQQMEESEIMENDFNTSNHPFIRSLDNRWDQQHLAFESQGNGENEPWVVSLASKTINNGLFEEQQFGVNFEIPLTFSKSHKQIDINTQTMANSDYYHSLDRMRVELSSQWSLLQSQQQNINIKHKLLSASANLSKKIAEQLISLHNEGEISHEVWLRRYLQTIDSQTALAINNLKNKQIKSMLNQAAGISL